MPEPTIAEETFAKLIAYWHGQKPLYRKDGETVTVANQRGCAWGWDGAHLERYVERHWHEYVDAARAVLEARS